MSDDALQSLLYVSTAEVPFTSVDLVNLTSRSEYANQKRDITGYLWFDGSMFLQYLEGPADAIDTLETKITSDPRHSIVKRFPRSLPADARRFTGWSMRLMNDNERFEMHMEGVLVALLEIPYDDEAPQARSPWNPFSQRYVAISAETSSLEKHLASSANLRAAASIRALVQASASLFGGGDGGGVINVLSDGGRGGSADASSMGQGGLLLINERATANSSAVRLARFFRAAQRTGTPKNSCSFGISSSGAGGAAWAVILQPWPPPSTRAAAVGLALRHCTYYPGGGSADSWALSNQ